MTHHEQRAHQVAQAVLVVAFQHLITRIYDKEKALSDTPKLISDVAAILMSEFSDSDKRKPTP
jgi:hypothetical protein